MMGFCWCRMKLCNWQLKQIYGRLQSHVKVHCQIYLPDVDETSDCAFSKIICWRLQCCAVVQYQPYLAYFGKSVRLCNCKRVLLSSSILPVMIRQEYWPEVNDMELSTLLTFHWRAFVHANICVAVASCQLDVFVQRCTFFAARYWNLEDFTDTWSFVIDCLVMRSLCDRYTWALLIQEQNR